MPIITDSTAHFNPFSPLTTVTPPGIDGVGVAYDADVRISANQPVSATATGTGTAYDATVSTNTLPAGMTSLVLDEQFTTLNAARWANAAEGETYGSGNNSIGRWRAQNTVVAAASSGGSGNSLQAVSKREAYNGASFTCGMISSKPLGIYYPVFGMYEARFKVPHLQGVWPAIWMRHRNGASMCELDLLEYFHSQRPGKFDMTLHRNDGTGLKTNVSYMRPFVEAPTVTPGWHTATMSLTQEGGNVRFKGWFDSPGGVGTPQWSYLDTASTYWAVTNGTSHPSGNGGANIFDIIIQGSQVGGNWVGHPDDPTGYSRSIDTCLSGGTKPNACNTSVGGYPIWTSANGLGGDFPAMFEVDYVKVWSAL